MCSSDLAVDMRLPNDNFAIHVDAGRLAVDLGRNDRPDCVVTGDQMALLPVLYTGLSVNEAVEAEMLAIEGNSDALTRLSTCFRSPKPAASPN